KIATAASHETPNFRTQPAISSAVAASTSGSRQGIGAPQGRQRHRRSTNETSGRLSYHANGVPHAMHAEPGWTTERRSGTRAAITFRKLPTARPGSRAIAASATSISVPAAVPERDRVVEREPLARIRRRLVEHQRDI